MDDIPRTLYRAYGELSGSAFSPTSGFLARDTERNVIDQSELSNHLNWNQRTPTMFISTTGSHSNALTMARAIRRWYGAHTRVFIATLDTRRWLPQRPHVHHMFTLANSLGVTSDLKARNHSEYLFVHSIPIDFVTEVQEIGESVSFPVDRNSCGNIRCQ
jgi:hypothetical protein